MDGGIPEIATAQTLRFQYNRIETLEALFDAHPNRIACVMLEPARSVEPAGGFLQQVEALCLAAMGLRMLSMRPASVGPIKNLLRRVDLTEVRGVIDAAMASGAQSVRPQVMDWLAAQPE
jgi:hypothetical protein